MTLVAFGYERGRLHPAMAGGGLSANGLVAEGDVSP